jgi:hypothetical protein
MFCVGTLKVDASDIKKLYREKLRKLDNGNSWVAAAGCLVGLGYMVPAAHSSYDQPFEISD